MNRDFPNLEVALLVGIGAGIPSPRCDIRLGDVAIAVPVDNHAGVLGYDMISVSSERNVLMGRQNATHPALGSAISVLRSRELAGSNDFTTHLTPLSKTPFRRPSACIDSRGRVAHYGCILSGNKVIRDATERDKLQKLYNATAIEMEAAGTMNRLPVAVIWGISDYGDADKMDERQLYAAASAAAYAKELLLQLPPLRRYRDASSSPATRMLLADLYMLLDKREEQRMGERLDWRNSVFDLLKLLGLDHIRAGSGTIGQ
ncbi:nucleoside phosphorylase domain-containing protein [Aspergillus undulatus]|uniref:nucleoside phosphorylase domain-containing protein n=1 Tax=Aspergillus undulatus TaxID=1810928 RepID=UPI003CCDA406